MSVEVALADKVAFLAAPESHAVERPAVVTTRETHLSWVFLTGRLAYKLKKPVRTPLLDFTTHEARRRNCLTELRLNHRLAPEVYRGMVPLTLEPGRRRGAATPACGAGGSRHDAAVSCRTGLGKVAWRST